jgi:tetratricopeptide (TPR) repeat protein
MFPINNKIDAKVGIYLNDDMRNYVYKQSKMGMTFQMEIGQYIVPISTQMATAMFNEVQIVTSPPPYIGAYRPDVEAVIVPEILYCYGNAIGTVTGYIESKVMLRVTGYDLNGNILWQGQSIGSSRSAQLPLGIIFLKNMSKVGEIGYSAALSATNQIINDFNQRPPQELYSLLEMKSSVKSKYGTPLSPNMADNLHQKGKELFDNKNYIHALYSFQYASKLQPSDIHSRFYIALCNFYAGRNVEAINELKSILQSNQSDQNLISDCKNWLNVINTPLNIGIVFINEINSKIYNKLNSSGIYSISEYISSKSITDEYLQKSLNKGRRIVLSIDTSQSYNQLMVDNISGGVNASEFNYLIHVNVFSTKKRNIIASFTVNQSTTRLSKQSSEGINQIYSELIDKSADKLLLNLLKNEIFTNPS